MMPFQSILDHLLRRPIRATGQVASETSTSETAKSETKGGTSFYLRFFLKDKPAIAGFVMIAVFLGWSLVEGIMQELGDLLKHQAYGWALLPSNPLALNFGSKLLQPSLANFPNDFVRY